MSAADALLLVNLGTPDAPTRAAVRRFLAEFLSDPRVVELPRLLWWPILHGIVLNTRPSASARRYQAIWMSEGSPLKVHTERQAKLVAGYLGEKLRPAPKVAYAMRYGAPSIGEALERLASLGVRRVHVVPLYPQYAGSTTASIQDVLDAYRGRHPEGPSTTLLPDFHDHPLYIRALVEGLREHQQKNGLIERLLISFHGLPQRAVDRGDPYKQQCERTAALIAEGFGLKAERWQISYQSRFGAARWLEPSTAAVLERWGREGVSRVDVVCPGFVSDCLETLEEIGIEGRQTFLGAGGREYFQVPCLNESHAWITALCDVAMKSPGTPEPARAAGRPIPTAPRPGA